MFTRRGINIKLLVQNLRDLDSISEKLSMEINKRNQVLQMGMKDDKSYRTFISKFK